MSSRTLFDFLLLAALWGASFLFMRVGVPEFGPFAMMGVRVGLAAVCLWCLVLATRREVLPAVRSHAGALALVGLLNSAIPFVLLSYATLSLTSGFTALINATTAFWTTLIGVAIFAQRLTRAQLLGLVIGVAGLFVLTWGKVDFKPGGSGLAVAAGLAATLSYGIALHWTKRKLVDVPPMGVALGSQSAAALALLPFLLTFWPMANPRAIAWASAIALAVFCTALAYILYFRIVARAGSDAAAAVTLVIPVFAAIWGWLFLREPVTLSMLAGGALVLVGTAVTLGVARIGHAAR
jgi:drug/metabolite transporter (DMT)-like permease